MRFERRRVLGLLGGGFAVAALPAFGQAKPHRIGFLGLASRKDSDSVARFSAFRAGLREVGYVEGKNLVIEERWADGKYAQLEALAQELLRAGVAVLVTYGTPGTKAAKQATKTTPIVMAIAGDAVTTGLVASIARPGGNVTGSTFFAPELAVKRLEFLREALPRARRVALLFNSDNPISASIVKQVQDAGKGLRLDVQPFGVSTVANLELAISSMAGKSDAVAVIEDAWLNANAGRIAALANDRKLPTIGFLELAESGGLISYGVDIPATFHRAAFFVDKILKGAKAGELPVEQASKFTLVVNLKTAQTLGVKMPRSLTVRADKVIE